MMDTGILPYSTDMSPYDYDFFAKSKEPLGGTYYITREIIHAVGRSLLDINRNGPDYFFPTIVLLLLLLALWLLTQHINNKELN
jgi:hypothetical protein